MAGKTRKSIVKITVVLLLAITPAIIAVTGVYFWFFLDAPYGNSQEDPAIVQIVRGTTFYGICKDLEDQGLVKNASYLQWRYRILSNLGLEKALQAGRYSVPYGRRPSEIIDIITSPRDVDRIYTDITIPPGFTASRIAKAVGKTGLTKTSLIEDAIGYLSADYPIVQTSRGLEGYLYPDTYKIENPVDASPESLKSTAESIVRIMADRFFMILDDIEPNWKKLTREQLHEKIILASIVEREYRVPEEAPAIAAVFNNRMDRNMPLQSCATIVYTIEETDIGNPYLNNYLQYNRRIFESYLEIDSPYNTYLYPDLPPGPISIPGKIALEAIFFPAKTDALYFVVKDPRKGTHVFSNDYSSHLNAREAYLTQFVVKD